MGAVTRLNGELLIEHAEHRITFRIFNKHQIQKHGTDVILTITNTNDLPLLEDGMTYSIDSRVVGVDAFKRSK